MEQFARLGFGLSLGSICVVCMVGLPEISRGEDALVSTSTSTSTSSSLPHEDEDIWCTATFKLYDPEEIVALAFKPSHFDSARCSTLVSGITASFDSFGVDITGFPNGFHGPAALVTCTDIFHHDGCPPELGDLSVYIYGAQGPDGALTNLPAICPKRLHCDDWPCGQDGDFVEVACGDVDGNGSIRLNDALAALRSAVGLSECLLQRCDTDRDGGVDTSDARSILATSVGLQRSLICPAPCASVAAGSLAS